MQFLDWDFSLDLSAAVHIGSGEEIHFTRAERLLLQALMSYRGRIWTGETLLDAVSGLSDEASHCSIDFIVNHLRHKLRDSARRPLYIETRYGEGYIWIAESPDIQTRARSALPPIGVRLNGNAVMSYCDRPNAERAVQGAVAVSCETAPTAPLGCKPRRRERGVVSLHKRAATLDCGPRAVVPKGWAQNTAMPRCSP